MLNLKDAIAEDIKEAIEAAQKSGEFKPLKKIPAVTINIPDKEDQGDYASAIALALTGQVNMPPMEILKIIGEYIPKKPYIGRLKAIEPGFINIWLNPGWLTSRLDNMIEEDLCADCKIGEGKKINLEFISANPTGPLTLGNIRTAFSADTLGKVLECAGYDVIREYYFNDSGAQIKKLGESVIRRVLQSAGHKIDYPEDMYQGDYIKDIGQTVAESFQENDGKEITKADLQDDKIIEQAGKIAATLLMTQIKKTIKEDLKIDFDVWTSEDELRENGKVDAVLQKLKKSELVYEKDGATYIKTTKYGDSEDRVVIKSDGQYAYIAPDIAYHQDKYDRGFDEIFTFVGADHQGHLPKVKAAMDGLGNDLSKLHQVVNQWMRILREGQPVKLSKRAGEIFSPQEMIEEVGYDAARFFMVQHALSTHMDFDLDLAKDRSERNPVYYVQYAYVRLQSILRQAKERGVIDRVGVTFDLTDSPALTHTLELNLMRQLFRFPEIVSEIASEFQVHVLTYYAQDIAKSVHVFYRHVPVLAGEDKNLIKSRLQLVLAAHTLLGKVLDLLGIDKPDVM